MAAESLPTLYNTDSSYYSMIARLALAEAGMAYTSRPVDIHRGRENQQPWFVRLNPEMTVPVLVDGDRVLPDSHLILDAALPRPAAGAQAELLSRLYRFPVDQFTFAWLMRWNPVVRFLFPRKLAEIRGDMLQLAAQNPDLADAYRKRAAVFDQRVAAFSQPPGPRWTALAAEADALLAEMEAQLGAADPLFGGAAVNATDVLATVFLARLRFCRQGRRIGARPAVAAYWDRVHGRPSFRQADVWDRLRPSLVLRLIG